MAEEDDDSLGALEYELNMMGLSVEDLQPPEEGHFDRRAMARVESARIMSRRFIERDRVKERISQQTKVRHHEPLQPRSSNTAVAFQSTLVYHRISFMTIGLPTEFIPLILDYEYSMISCKAV